MPRFQKGQSGNPKGRPLGARSFATQFLEEVAEPMPDKPISKLQATIKAQVDKAAGGDLRAVERVLDRVEALEAKLAESMSQNYPFSEADRETIAEIHRRLEGRQ